MNRKKLLNTLTMLQPALAVQDTVPYFNTLWFDGGNVFAYNGKIGMSANLKTKWKGGLPGRLLLEVLKMSNAEDVTLEPKAGKEGVVQIKKTDNSIIEAELALSEFDATFTMPSHGDHKVDVDLEEFILGLERCLITTNEKTQEYSGVVFASSKEGKAHMYSTNGESAVRALVVSDIRNNVVLSSLFCKQLISMDRDEEAIFDITDRHALYVSNGVSLFGSLLSVTPPADFGGMFQRHFSPEVRKTMAPIPEGFSEAIKNAAAISSYNVEKATIKLEVKNGVMKIIAEAKSGSIALGKTASSIKFSGHPDVTAIIEPKSLKDGIGFYTHVAVTSEAVVMKKDNGNITVGVMLIGTTSPN